MRELFNTLRHNYLILLVLIGITYLCLVISFWNGPGYQERKASSTELSRVIKTSEWFRSNGLFKTSGIKDYTHYPETPTYIVFFLTKILGFSPLDYALPFRLLTTIPLNLLSILLIGWLFKDSKWNFLLIIPLFVMIFQKGICHWSGNLEQEAYGLAFGLIGIPIGLYCGERINYLIPFIYGFVITSFSFDYTLVSTFTFLASWLIGQRNLSWKNLSYTFLLILLGALTALALHFVQIASYYHSIQLAFNDLCGSALARSNIMNNLNPSYAKSAINLLPSNYSYWNSVVVPISHLPSASSHLFRILFIITTVFAIGNLLRLLTLTAFLNIRFKLYLSFSLALLGLFLWPILFPNHTQQHNFHFIPRHSFIFFSYILFLLSRFDSVKAIE